MGNDVDHIKSYLTHLCTDRLPVECNLPLEESVSHDHAAEVLRNDLDEEVEDHGLHLPPALASLAAAIIAALDVDMDEDLTGIAVEEF